MKALFKKLALIIMVPMMLALPSMALPGGYTVHAAGLKSDACDGLKEVGGDCGDTGGIDDFVASVVKIISYIVGVAAIVMILVSGFRFMTSGGDSGKVASARSTLVYALIGLAIAVLAQVLVRVVVNQSASVAAGCTSSQHVEKNAAGKDVCVANPPETKVQPLCDRAAERDKKCD